MIFHGYLDSVLLSLCVLMIGLYLLASHRREAQKYQHLIRLVKALGITSIRDHCILQTHSYQDLKHITAMAGIDDWDYGCNDVLGHYVTTNHEIFCQAPTADPQAQYALSGRFRYIATFNPRLMVQILHRLHTTEWTLQAVRTLLPQAAPIQDVIRFCLDDRLREDAPDPTTPEGQAFLAGIYNNKTAASGPTRTTTIPS